MDRKTIILMVFEAIILIGIGALIWVYYDEKNEKYEQNWKAAESELRELKLENGNLLYKKDLYILKERELSNVIEFDKKEIKELKNALESSLAYISKMESKVEIDSIIMVRDSIVYVSPADAVAKFSFQNNWVTMNGSNLITFNGNNISNISTAMSKIDIKTPLTVGITEDYQIFVKTSNPYVQITDINGAILDASKFAPKKKRFGWGVQAGVGAQYGLFSQKFDVGPYVGVGFEINF